MRLASTRVRTALAVGTALTVVGGGTAVAVATALDPGQKIQREVNGEARDWFGVLAGLPASSTADLNQAQALADPAGLVSLAPGLKASVVSAGNAAANIDQMVLWPAKRPTHLIGCNEEGTTSPALQKIDLATGVATTIATGLTSCDPVRATPWGTVIFGEEAGDTGRMYELINPLDVTGLTIDRVTGATSDEAQVRTLPALGLNSFEGIALFPNGVTYYGNELSANNGADAGAYYKFVPTTPWPGGAPITSLDRSPYASGSVSALRVGTNGNNGQGFQYGTGSWQPLAGSTGTALAPLAVAAGATGYYRPEDLDIDAKALAAGNIRFCGNNTGRDSSRYYGETVCFTDGALAASTGATVPQVQLLVNGSPELNMPDNIAYQPGRGNWVVHEDGTTVGNVNGDRNNDLWSCLDDGKDADLSSDGCIRVGTLNDLDAEWTGGFFDASGKNFYVSVQHNSSGFGTILKITGWK
jgi:hypothetical protein